MNNKWLSHQWSITYDFAFSTVYSKWLLFWLKIYYILFLLKYKIYLKYSLFLIHLNQFPFRLELFAYGTFKTKRFLSDTEKIKFNIWTYGHQQNQYYIICINRFGDCVWLCLPSFMDLKATNICKFKSSIFST